MVQTRRLGRTNHERSVAVLGAAAFWNATTEDAEPAFRASLDAGVNHLDIAPRYGDAELALGPLVPGVRERLFVGCKTTRANPDGVRAQLEESLTRLGCDAFDPLPTARSHLARRSRPARRRRRGHAR